MKVVVLGGFWKQRLELSILVGTVNDISICLGTSV